MIVSPMWISAHLRAYVCMFPLRSQWVDYPDMSRAPKLLPQHEGSKQEVIAFIAL
jgi:hypothetical protein